MRRPKVAFFDFACCEGCQLQVANIGEDAAGRRSAAIDVVEFREVDVREVGRGARRRLRRGEHHRRARRGAHQGDPRRGPRCCRLRLLRHHRRGQRHEERLRPRRRSGSYVYGDRLPALPDRPDPGGAPGRDGRLLGQRLPGLSPEFIAVLKCVLQGIPYYVPDHAVCVECKLQRERLHVRAGGHLPRAGDPGRLQLLVRQQRQHLLRLPRHAVEPEREGGPGVLARYGIRLEHVVNKMEMYNTLQGVGLAMNKTKPQHQGRIPHPRRRARQHRRRREGRGSSRPAASTSSSRRGSSRGCCAAGRSSRRSTSPAGSAASAPAGTRWPRIQAAEDALGVMPSAQTIKLRKLLLRPRVPRQPRPAHLPAGGCPTCSGSRASCR